MCGRSRAAASSTSYGVSGLCFRINGDGGALFSRAPVVTICARSGKGYLTAFANTVITADGKRRTGYVVVDTVNSRYIVVAFLVFVGNLDKMVRLCGSRIMSNGGSGAW